MTEKRITERYLKSEQISIMGIRCTFTRGIDVGTRMKVQERSTGEKKCERAFSFFSRVYTDNCDKCFRDGLLSYARYSEFSN